MSERQIIKQLQTEIGAVSRALSFFKSDIRMLQEKVRHLESKIKDMEKERGDDE